MGRQGGGDCWPRGWHCWHTSTRPVNINRTDTWNRRPNVIPKGTRGRGVWGCEWSSCITPQCWSGSQQHNCNKCTHTTNTSTHRWWCSKWRPQQCKKHQQCHQWQHQPQQQLHQQWQQQEQHQQHQQQQWQQWSPVKQQQKVLERSKHWWGSTSSCSSSTSNSSSSTNNSSSSSISNSRWWWSCGWVSPSSWGKFPWRNTPTGWWSPTILLSPTNAVFSSGVPATWWWQLPSRVISTVWTRSQSQTADRGKLDTGWWAGGCTTPTTTAAATAAAG